MVKILLLLILIVGVFIRFYRLDWTPPHLSNDEISIAYDAYSIARTLKDEHGNFLPISFQSHGTYKAPLYAYILAPLTLILNNTEFTARFPSAFLGSLTIVLIGLIGWRLSGKKAIGLIGSIMLAVNPWHIYVSRMALESNVALFFLVLAVWLLLEWEKLRRNILLFVAVIAVVLSMYAYHTQWVLVPLLMIGVFWIYLKKLNWKITSALGCLTIIMLLPLMTDFWKNLETTARANTEMLWKNIQIESVLKNPEIPVISKFSLIGKSWLNNYFDYTNPAYLFFDGLNLFPEKNAFRRGLFLIPMLPLAFWGLIKFKKYILPQHRQFFWWWLLAGPVLPALTQGGNNFIRNLPSVIPYTLAISIGFYNFWGIKKKTALIFCGLLTISFGYFVLIYFNIFPKHSGLGFQYGYKQESEFARDNYQKYDKFVIETRFGDYNVHSGVPHLYFGYFARIDPAKMIGRIENEEGLSIDKYVFKSINWNVEEIKQNYIYMVPMSNLPEGKEYTIRKEIQYPDGKAAFRIIEFNRI